LDAVACAAEHADPTVNIPNPYGLWALMDEMTSRDCGYSGEAVEPTVDPGLLDEVQVFYEGGMPLIGLVATALGANDCFRTTEECLKDLDLQHRCGLPLKDRMFPIGPTVAVEDVKYEK